MGLIVSPVTAAVTIGGVPYPLAVPVSLSDCLAPEVDAAELEIPWGARRISGGADPSEVLPALGAEVVVTAGAYTWRGTLTARGRSASGARRHLRLSARGPGLELDRAYLPTFARAGVSGVVQAPGGPRFAPGTRSATAGGPGGTYYLGGTGDWTVAQAVAAYLAHAPEAGLPALTLDAGAADLTRRLGDVETDGQSFHAGLVALIGHRSGLAWRAQLTAGGRVVRVRGLAGTGAAVDLTGGDVLDYDVAEDASAALASLEVRGARKVYVFSIDGKISGDLVADWTGTDETARAAGDRSSPAYRRFRLANIALPDGSPILTADPWPTLPIDDDGTLGRGSSPWLAFAQRTSDSIWESLQGRVSIAAGGGKIYIEGIEPAEWATWSRLRVTVAYAPRAHLAATRTGGSGLGRGIAMVGGEHVVAAGAAVRLAGGGGSLASVTGTARSDQGPVDDEASALWASLGAPQLLASWSRETCGGDPEPGARITSLILPVPGAAPTTVTCDAIVGTRRIARSGGRWRTTWTIAPRPYATGAIVR